MTAAAGKINWGILGCAGIAEKAFIPAVLKSHNGVLAAIASRDEARAADCARRFGFLKSCRTYQELVDDPAIDAVYNPLPNDQHAEWSIRAMRAGKHVLCEKPLALNAAEARAMIQAAADERRPAHGRLHVQVPSADREDARAHRRGDNRRTGGPSTPPSLSASIATARIIAGSRRAGGGALYDVGCYTISIARLILGAEPLAVSAAAHIDPATGVDKTTAVLLEFPGARFALCESSFETHFQSRLLAVGTDGTPPPRAGLFGQRLRRRRRDRPGRRRRSRADPEGQHVRPDGRTFRRRRRR